MSKDITPEEVNDNMIPAELKEQLTKKVNLVLSNISAIEKTINDSIDDAIENSENPITITEINAALLNVLKKMNQREIMEIIK